VTYRSHIKNLGAFPCRCKARYRYRILSANDHARASARYAWDEAVLEGNAYHTIQTWMMRVMTCRAVVLVGDFIRPEKRVRSLVVV
jgi:hypothetical protein